MLCFTRSNAIEIALEFAKRRYKFGTINNFFPHSHSVLHDFNENYFIKYRSVFLQCFWGKYHKTLHFRQKYSLRIGTSLIDPVGVPNFCFKNFGQIYRKFPVTAVLKIIFFLF